MKKIVALIAVLFSVVVPVQSQAADSKALVIIDSYFQSSVAQNPITASGTACKQVAPVKNATPSSPYNHGTAMYAVAKLQNPNLNIIPICGATATAEMTPAMFINTLTWVNNNSSNIGAVSFSRFFNHATKPCMPTASAPYTPETGDREIKRLIAALKSKGIAVFASTGNVVGKSVNYPACLIETESVVHANEVGSSLGQFNSNTKYFVKITDDGSKFAYNTNFGLVSHSSSSATAAVASMWLTASVAPGIVKPKI
jgi:hypothetical protein